MPTAGPRPFTTRPEIQGTFGVVATTHWIATAVAMSILEKGGNAFDAAVAAGFTLQVVEPHLNGPAGEVPMIVWNAKAGEAEVICGQGVAPAAATIAHYRGLSLDLVPGTGLLAACVPGSFDAWMLLLLRQGTMRIRDVMEPAIYYARNGIPVIPRIAATVAGMRATFEEHWPSSAELYLRDGDVPRPGTLHVNPILARTYERLLKAAEKGEGGRKRQIERARAAWSRGFVAEAIDRYCRTNEVMDVSGERHFGVLTGEDMANWEASIEAPLAYDYHGHTVLKAGPWSQGPVMLQQLALLSGFDLSGLDPTGPDFIHLQTECAKLAFADREAFYGDPNFVDVPIKRLLSKDYNAKRRALVGTEASAELRPGTIRGSAARMANGAGHGLQPQPSAAGAGEPTMAVVGAGRPTIDQAIDSQVPQAERGDTVHLDIIDRWGNMISATPSGGWLQSSPVIPALGFPLGTRAQMFWLDEGLPASLAPGKRPRTTLSVSLALRDGAPYLSWGTPGGDQQDQWNTQFFLRHVHFGLNLQEAIDWPAWHTEHFPTSFWPRTVKLRSLFVEDRIPAATIAELRRRGHEVAVGGPWSEGRLGAASKEGKTLRAAADPRSMQGYAAGR